MRNIGVLLALAISFLPLAGGANKTGPLAAARPLFDIPLLVEDVDGLGLFLDELHETRILLAAWATQQSLSVVDVERTQQIFARASAGKHAETGASCGRPLAIEIPERWQKELGAKGKLDAGVTCKELKCTLSVHVADALGVSGKYLTEYAAPFDTRLPWRTALPRALATLVLLSPDQDDGGGIGTIMGMEAEVRARPERLTWTVWPARAQDGRDTATPRDYSAEDLRALMPRGADELRACLAPHGQQVSVLLEVSAVGTVTRCETAMAQDDSTKCVCGSLTRSGAVEAPLRGKRVFGTLTLEAADIVTPDGYLARAFIVTHLVHYKDRDGRDQIRTLVSDPSIAAWQEPENHALAACFRDVTGSVKRDFGGRVTFDAGGRAIAVALNARSGKIALTESQASCVKEAFLTSRAPCPALPQTTASATVDISFRPTTAVRRPANP